MNNKKVRNISAAIILILIITIFTIVSFNKTIQAELTQLSAQGSRQMMGYLLKTINNKVIIIDGGTVEDTDNLINYINKNGGKVDYWFLTHAHDDHAGAFTKIVEETHIQIENIYVSLNDYSWYEQYEPSRKEFSKKLIDILNSEEIKDKVKNPNINDVIQIDNLTAEILGIKNPEITENAGNEQSMVIKFNTKKTTILFLGDTGEASSKKLLQNKEKLKSDVVQMSHHGQAGASKELYEAVSPKICLWPTPQWLWDNNAGEGENTGPWKTFETRKWVEELKVKINYISKDGDITINIY